MDIAQLEQQTLEDLRHVARENNVTGYSRLKKPELILSLLRHNAEKQGYQLRGGVLEIVDDGIGFLRAEHYLPGPNDIYVSQTQIKRFNLRTGDMVVGQVRAGRRGLYTGSIFTADGRLVATLAQEMLVRRIEARGPGR